jgi:hypothetical protein
MLYLQINQRPLAHEHFIQARDLGNEDARMFLNQYFP